MTAVTGSWPGSLYFQKNNSESTLASMGVSRRLALFEIFENGEKKYLESSSKVELLVEKAEIKASRDNMNTKKGLLPKNAQPSF